MKPSGAILIGTILMAMLAGPMRFARAGEEIDLRRPGDREFILDKAGVIKPEDQAKIRQLCDKLLTERALPIIVVTINSTADHGGRGMSIEAFARKLFDQWGVGIKEINKAEWNRGVLLLVAKGDRRARIELGAGYHRDADEKARQVMDTLIIPKFKAGDYSGGIVAGVEGLDKLGRGEALPKPPTNKMVYVIWAIFIGLAIFTAVSLARRGASGWAWLMWAGIFTVIYLILSHLLSNAGRSSGGGWSGGSFGGGYSGGGGASGSW